MPITISYVAGLDVSRLKSCEDACLAFPDFEHYQHIASEILALDSCETVTASEGRTLIVETIETIVEPSGM